MEVWCYHIKAIVLSNPLGTIIVCVLTPSFKCPGDKESSDNQYLS